MKTFKNILIILIVIAFSNTLAAQEDVVTKQTRKERKSVKKTDTYVVTSKGSQTDDNQDELTCELFYLIFQNYSNNYTHLIGQLRDTKGSMFKTYHYKKQMPNRFVDHSIDKKHGVFNLTAYKGSDQKKAEQHFVKLYNWLTEDCAKKLNREYTFIKDAKKNYIETGKRDVFLTTTTDNILIKIKLWKTKAFNKDKKFVDQYEASLSFIKLKDKQKVINKILNK